jgi:phosphoribosylglycinamide formyltransferase-1
LQRTVDIAPDDTVETLAERILVEEHQIYPQAVKAVLEELRPVD